MDLCDDRRASPRRAHAATEMGKGRNRLARMAASRSSGASSLPRAFLITISHATAALT